MTVIPERNDCVLDQENASGVVRGEYSGIQIKENNRWNQLCLVPTAFPQGHLSKTISSNCLTKELTEAVYETWGKQ